MSESQATVGAPSPAVPKPPRRRMRWVVLGIVAGATLIVVLLSVIGIRALIAAIPPSLRATNASALEPGSCLTEAGTGLPQYTVVFCAQSHLQEVVGTVDLSVSGNPFSHYSVMAKYSQAVCERYLEYGLFIDPAIADARERANYVMSAIYVPTETEFNSGTVLAVCTIARADGAALTSSLYRPAP